MEKTVLVSVTPVYHMQVSSELPRPFDIREVIANYCPLSYIVCCKRFLEHLVYQMKAGSFPDRLISST